MFSDSYSLQRTIKDHLSMCELCRSALGESPMERMRRQIEESMRISPSSLFSAGYSPTFSIFYDPAKETKKPMTTSDHTPESLAAAVRDLGNKDGCVRIENTESHPRLLGFLSADLRC